MNIIAGIFIWGFSRAPLATGNALLSRGVFLFEGLTLCICKEYKPLKQGETIMHAILEAFERNKVAAHEAYVLFLEYYPDAPRVPGCSTAIRLAWRIENGRNVEEAAAAEYLYRWNLAIKPGDQVLNTCVRNPCVSVFGTPHTIGM
jgi:hypothetical protein